MSRIPTGPAGESCCHPSCRPSLGSVDVFVGLGAGVGGRIRVFGEQLGAVLVDVASVDDVAGVHAGVGVRNAGRVAGAAVGVAGAGAAADSVFIFVGGQVPVGFVFGHGG